MRLATQDMIAFDSDGALIAVEGLEEALRREPAHLATLLQLGAAYHQCARYADAARLLRRATHVNPRAAAAHDLLGRSLAALGRRPEALSAFRAVLDLRPGGEAESHAARVLWEHDHPPAVPRVERVSSPPASSTQPPDRTSEPVPERTGDTAREQDPPAPSNIPEAEGASPAGERVLYEDDVLRITPDCVVVDREVLALRGYSKARVAVVRPCKGSAWALIACGVVLTPFAGFCFGWLILTLGFVLLQPSHARYSVRLTGGSGDVDLLSLPDYHYISEVVRLINETLAAPRGATTG